MVEGARLESVCASNRTGGSNPLASAKCFAFDSTDVEQEFSKENSTEAVRYASASAIFIYNLLSITTGINFQISISGCCARLREEASVL